MEFGITFTTKNMEVVIINQIKKTIWCWKKINPIFF